MNAVGRGVQDFIGGILGADKKRGAKSHGKATASSTKSRGKSATRASLAKVDAIPSAHPLGKKKDFREKNLHAKLRGNNSLVRNINAYLNSQSPRMIAFREFIGASIAYEDALAAVAELEGPVLAAREAFAPALDGIVAYDDFDYTEVTIAELEERLGALNEIEQGELAAEDADALNAEIDALSAALETEEAAALAEAENNLSEAEMQAGELQAAASDEALAETLAATGSLVDQEVVDWAKEQLGVGDAYGKIDEYREAMEAFDAEEAAADEPADDLDDDTSADAGGVEEGGLELAEASEELRLDTQ
ncbi:hypothetical protein GR183_06110 [Stappia sp. GBMRC 2046]|uniref:Uncharacterized protein n=1 Tax=Stappia sediminis TaxID=2692190 RepID=A0A7X3S771_9HYPH|nr:hypothetical protein [Stappia sediminis]